MSKNMVMEYNAKSIITTLGSVISVLMLVKEQTYPETESYGALQLVIDAVEDCSTKIYKEILSELRDNPHENDL